MFLEKTSNREEHLETDTVSKCLLTLAVSPVSASYLVLTDTEAEITLTPPAFLSVGLILRISYSSF